MDLKSHPVVEGVLGPRHAAEVGAVGLWRHVSGEGAGGRAGGRVLVVARLRPGHGVLQGQRGIGHPPDVHLLPGRSHI